MDDFSITCTTCKSRLKVRDQAAIGQILACPKCGGMVLVKPPAEQPAPGIAEQPPAVTSAVDVNSLRETIGDSTFNDVDELLSDAPPRPKVPAPLLPPGAPTKLARPLETPAPTPALAATVPPEPSPPAPALPTASVAATADSSETAADLAGIDWNNERPWRYWALLAGSLIAGVVLAVAVVVVSIRMFRDDSPTAVAVVPENSAAATAPPAPVAIAPAPVSPAPVAQPAAADDPPVAKLPATTPPPSLPTDNDPPADAAANSATAPQPPSPQPAPPQAPASATDPLGLTADPPPAVASAPARPPGMKDPLGQFGALLEGADDNPLPTTETPAEPAKTPAGDADSPDDKPERAPLARPPALDINVTARLADPLPAIDLDGVPLADFLQVMSNLSTVPITLRPDELWFVKSAPGAPVTYRGANTTVGAALRDALAPLGLEATVADGQAVVALTHTNPPRSINFPIKDLVAGDEQQAAQLADWMKALVAPASWGDEGGTGQITISPNSLAISQQSPVHAELLRLCEKLRVARGLKPLTVARYDAKLFSLEPRSARAADKLSTPITLNFNQPTLLVKLIERLGTAGKLRILIDWQSLATSGWTTETEATLLADKLPLGETLTRLLEPMDLAWRVVDENTLQILSAQSLADSLELEFYKLDGLVADSAAGEALVQRVTSTLGEELFTDGGGSGAIRYDAAGNCLLVALAQPEQQALGKLLAAWSEATPPAPTAATLGSAR